jgi:acetyl esterase
VPAKEIAMPLDPQARFVLDQIAAQGGMELTEASPAEARQMFEKMRVPVPGEAVARVEDRMIPGPAGSIPVRVYAPAGAGAAAPAIAFFHGGGWVIGSLETHDNFCRALANRSAAVVVSIDYRLAPEHRFPAAAEDCYAATRWIAERGSELGADGSRLAVAGDSAGGNLAAVVALMCRDRSGPSLRHQGLIYPVTDPDFDRPSYLDNAEGYLLTRAAMQWFWDHYVPDAARRHDAYAAPLRAEKLAGVAPATVVTAEYDPLRDEGEAYAERLRDAGVPTTLTRYDGQIHGFVGLFEVFDAGKQATEQIAKVLRESLA